MLIGGCGQIVRLPSRASMTLFDSVPSLNLLSDLLRAVHRSIPRGQQVLTDRVGALDLRTKSGH